MATRTRSAKDGQFKTKKYGKKHPGTTINEVVKPKKKAKTKNKK